MTLHQIITINTIPLDKTINIVEPDLVQGYEQQFKFKEYETRVKLFCSDFGLSDQTEPMDLSFSVNDDYAATAAITVTPVNHDCMIPSLKDFDSTYSSLMTPGTRDIFCE